ncbi:MAG TPA: disulfide bond formation protein DsbA [Micromonosporaceae bacterium]|jgi:2-hydroxychromene-2-carboxylate isomerase|nr:disulfide bond formation protein DsbA [Micromonosporaceae bacterium]
MADDVTFYFDPTCPFTWRTSRWLRAVTQPRGHTIGWKLMSLKMLNEGRELPEAYRDRVAFSIRAVRVLQATLDNHGPDALDRVYTEFGTRLHYQHATLDDDLLVTAIAAADLPADLAKRADDGGLDATIRASHEAGQARVGQESGSPIVAIGDGPGFFGPVVVPVPEGEEAEKLYDAVRLLSAVPAFSELKRSRASF